MTESKKDSNYFSLLSICILFALFSLFNYISHKTTILFLIVQLLSVSWVIIFMSAKRLNIWSGLPLIIISPFMVLQLSTVNSLALYHIIQAVFAFHFLFKCDISLRDQIIMYLMFLGAYILTSFLHEGFNLMEMAVYGGALLHLLLISLGITTHRSNEFEREADELRSRLLGMKDGFKDNEQDPLMGIFSKSGGMKVLKQTMKWSQRYEIPLTVCYMELNNSRDDYIHSITRRIVNRVRESDTLFRLGKSEILLILPDCQKNDAASVMKSIQEILQNDREMEAVQFGLADFKAEHKTSPNELIINANSAIA
jgi:GGDEF domain-containing protein